MAILTPEQKDFNINERFETPDLGSGMRRYTITLTDGKTFSLLCPDGSDLAEAERTCRSKFGDRFLKARAGG